MIFCEFSLNLTKRVLNLSIFEPQMNEYGLEREITSSTRLYLNETSSHFAKKLRIFPLESSKIFCLFFYSATPIVFDAFFIFLNFFVYHSSKYFHISFNEKKNFLLSPLESIPGPLLVCPVVSIIYTTWSPL